MEQRAIQTVEQSGGKQVLNLPTVEAYNLWAKTYDNDGNVLQKVDNVIFGQLLGKVFGAGEGLQLAGKGSQLRIMDLGCGTGRNTVKLLLYASQLLAVDNSDGMMAVAKQKVESYFDDQEKAGRLSTPNSVHWINHNINDESPEALLSKLETPTTVDLVSSTLVLEHIKLDPFFSTVRTILKPNGILLFTNMHHEMGSVSQAGFNDEEKGVKIRPVSYNHAVQEILEHAKKAGFQLEGEVIETGVRDLQHAEELGARAQKWVGVKLHLAMIFRRALVNET